MSCSTGYCSPCQRNVAICRGNIARRFKRNIFDDQALVENVGPREELHTSGC